MSYRSCVWRICTYCTYFSQGSWNNVGVPLIQESLLSEYEDYGHFQLESSYFSLHVHDFISSLIRPTHGAFRVAGNESISNWKYVHISWRKEIMKRVSLFVAYSWQRLYVSYKKGMTKLALLNYLVMSWGVCHFFINGWSIDPCYRFRLFDLCCWPWEIRLYLLWW